MVVAMASEAQVMPQDEHEEEDANGASVEEAEEDDLALQQALALNEQLRRMELEATAEQQQQRQQLAPPAPPLHEQQNMQRNIPVGRRPAPAARATSGAKNGGWGGSTHTVDRARSIERENANLVKHLTAIATAPRSSAQEGGRGSLPSAAVPRPRASAAINRQRQNDQIAQENARLVKRLAGAKPAISNFKDHAAKQDALKRNASRSREAMGRTGGSAAMLPPRRLLAPP